MPPLIIILFVLCCGIVSYLIGHCYGLIAQLLAIPFMALAGVLFGTWTGGK